jgi:hypothetical protein
MDILLYIVTAIAALWFLFRVVWFVRKRVRLWGERRTRNMRCPACKSKRLDDYSDPDSGMCLDCGHVWGVSVP